MKRMLRVHGVAPGGAFNRWTRQLSSVLLLSLAVASGTSMGAQAPGLATFEVRGSVKQLFVIGARAKAAVLLRNAQGQILQGGTTDKLGGFVFRNVPPGEGYVAIVGSNAMSIISEPATVLSEDYVPPQSLYDQQVLVTGPYGKSGYGYINTRDGTKLSVQVQLPEGSGPFPTLIEYSGYGPSDPTADDVARGSIQPFRFIAALLDYAYVGVNIRGTGCSGGAFDYFEKLQSLDGYDIVETVAAQPWAARVGMWGISYAGISQLFVAQTRPPHLAAISPLSSIDDTFRATLYPGGIFNDGFALSWAMERQEQNRWPNPVGADWVVAQVSAGDEQCAANQLLRQQNPDLLAKIERNPFFPAKGNPDYPEGGEILSPYSFVDRIEVPVFIAGAWQDEQTGGHWPVMLERFSRQVDLRVTATNGTHADALGPYPLRDLLEFLDFNVAQRVPSIPLIARLFAPALYSMIFASAGVQLPIDRFQGMTYQDARALYDDEDRIHVYWETGAGPGAATPGSPEPAAQSSYTQWPPAETVATAWYLQPNGQLQSTPPVVSDEDPLGSDSYEYDPAAKPRGDFRCPGGGEPNTCRDEIWKATAVYDWRPLPEGKALSYQSGPLTSEVTMLGSGSVDLWIKSTTVDTDLEVTLSEIRPDGQERYVQNGWLRASHRRLDLTASTELRPRHTHLEADAELLPAGEFIPLRVELFPFGHVFRGGSRLRISIETPGGNRPLWTFDVLERGKKGISNWIAHSSGRPSRIVLPVVPNVEVPPELPACPRSLRSQPCRAFTIPQAAIPQTAMLGAH